MVIYGVSNIYTLLFSTRSLGVCVQTDFQPHCMHLIPGRINMFHGGASPRDVGVFWLHDHRNKSAPWTSSAASGVASTQPRPSKPCISSLFPFPVNYKFRLCYWAGYVIVSIERHHWVVKGGGGVRKQGGGVKASKQHRAEHRLIRWILQMAQLPNFKKSFSKENAFVLLHF